MKNKIKNSIEIIKRYEPSEGYWVGYSGGKDSDVVKELVKMSGVKAEFHYNMTTIDPPEVVKHIRSQKDIIIDRPEKSFFQLLQTKGFPLMNSRWCCGELKEKGGAGRIVILGIRSEESFKRKNRKIYDEGYRNKIVVHPILDWTEADVWQFIEDKNIKYCSLYDEGFSRIGCILCPLQSKKKKQYELNRYPKYRKAFIHAFEKLYNAKKTKGNKSIKRWKDGKEMFYWWILGNEYDFETLTMFDRFE